METKSIPSNADIRLVPTNAIIPDPNQPRKTFHTLSMEELRASIQKDGIMQSLLLRNHGDKFMIIFGERRYRVACELGIKEVPAIVIEASDEQVLRKQLVENLQRENLLPMEQAIGFKTLAEKCQMNVEEIAATTGKSVYFIRQQIKLTDLIPQWQKMVSKKALSITTALQICLLPESVQKELYHNHVSKEDEKSEKPIIQINQYTINKYMGILLEASFDLADPDLNPKMGACTVCPFNSAYASLFPDEKETPKCNNISCFNNKTATHLKRELVKAKDDPTILLAYDGYSMPDDVKKLKSEGSEVLKLGYADECREIKEPQKPVWEEYEKWGKRQNLTSKEIKANFDKAEEDYAFSRQVHDKNVANGKYKKAFVVHDQQGRQTGKYIYVEINTKKSTAKQTQQGIANGTATLEDINNEINRLQERETRAKELDGEKVQEKIVQALKGSKTLYEIPKAGNRVDNVLINFLLTELVSYSTRPAIDKMIKPSIVSDSMSVGQFYKAIESLTRQQISFIIRQIIVDKYGNCLPNTKGGIMIRKMAESLGCVPIADFEKEQKEKAAKRQQRLKERLDELKKQKQKLSASRKKESHKQNPRKKAVAA